MLAGYPESSNVRVMRKKAAHCSSSRQLNDICAYEHQVHALVPSAFCNNIPVNGYNRRETIFFIM